MLGPSWSCLGGVFGCIGSVLEASTVISMILEAKIAEKSIVDGFRSLLGYLNGILDAFCGLLGLF